MQQQERAALNDSPTAIMYSRYAPGIFAYLCRHIPSREDAEDILLEVFLAALEHGRFLTLSEKEQLAWLWADEQIERLTVEADSLSPATRLVHDLRNTYQSYATNDARSLERVWERLAHSENQKSSRQDNNNQPVDLRKFRQERSEHM